MSNVVAEALMEGIYGGWLSTEREVTMRASFLGLRGSKGVTYLVRGKRESGMLTMVSLHDEAVEGVAHRELHDGRSVFPFCFAIGCFGFGSRVAKMVVGKCFVKMASICEGMLL